MKRTVKILCPRCERLLPLQTFRLEGASLVLTCTGCGVETRIEPSSAQVAMPSSPSVLSRPVSQPPRVSLASTEGGSNVVVLRTAGHEAVSKAAASADQTPFAVPETVCPRCIAPRAQANECPHCGISFEKYEESMTLPPRWLRDDWVALLRDWGNDAKHVQLRRKAQQLDSLAAVGRLYRVRLAYVPEDPMAAEGRADVLRLASVPISFAPPDEVTNARRRNVLFGLGGLFIVAVVLMLLRSLWS